MRLMSIIQKVLNLLSLKAKYIRVFAPDSSLGKGASPTNRASGIVLVHGGGGLLFRCRLIFGPSADMSR